MKADFQDRLNIEKPKSSFKTWFIFGALATCIIGGLLILNKDKDSIIYKGTGEKVVHFLKNQKMPISETLEPIIEYVVPPRPVREPRPVAVRPEDVTSPIIEQWERERKEKKQAQVQKRQTVFNDDNYQPRGAINSIPAPRQIHTSTTRRQINTQAFTKSAPWSWESYGYGTGTRTNRKGGQFSYTVRNGLIDTNSVCNNYKYGSLDYRDCRKGAKRYFQRACSNGNHEACSGADMMP